MSPVLAGGRGSLGFAACPDRQFQAKRRAYPHQLSEVDLGSMLLQPGDAGLAHADALGQCRLGEALCLARGLKDRSQLPRVDQGVDRVGHDDYPICR